MINGLLGGDPTPLTFAQIKALNEFSAKNKLDGRPIEEIVSQYLKSNPKIPIDPRSAIFSQNALRQHEASRNENSMTGNLIPAEEIKFAVPFPSLYDIHGMNRGAVNHEGKPEFSQPQPEEGLNYLPKNFDETWKVMIDSKGKPQLLNGTDAMPVTQDVMFNAIRRKNKGYEVRRTEKSWERTKMGGMPKWEVFNPYDD